jgi:hypothetical protein
MEVVKLTKKNLIADMESGLTRSKMGEKYGLSTGMINRAMKQMGIEEMRAKVVKFIIVEDDEEAIDNQTPPPDFFNEEDMSIQRRLHEDMLSPVTN